MRHASFVLLTCPKTLRILLQKRTYDTAKGAGKWFCFGGSGEKGESPVETAVREFKEETGIKQSKYDIDSNPLIQTVMESDGKSPVKIYVFIATTDIEHIPDANDESSGWAWAELSEIQGMQLHPVMALLLTDKDASSRLATSLKK